MELKGKHVLAVVLKVLEEAKNPFNGIERAHAIIYDMKHEIQKEESIQWN